MATYYLYNGSKDVNIYKSASKNSKKMGTIKKKDYVKATALKNGFYKVNKGYVDCRDVYADNVGSSKKYKNYFNQNSDSGMIWKDKSIGNLLLFSKINLQAKSIVFVHNSASSSSTKIGFLNSGCIIIINLACYDPTNMAVRHNSTSTVENSEGMWYKIYSVSGEYTGVVKDKWINLTTNKDLLSKKSSSTNMSTNTSSTSSSASPVEEEKTVEAYSEYMTKEQYSKKLEDGLKVEDLRNVFGMPYQFLPLTDPRIDVDDNGSNSVGSIEQFGSMYTKKIINPMPLLLMTPGSPEFMSSYNKSQRSLMLGKYLNLGIDSTTLESLINEKSGKFYSLRYNYTEYFYYVNAMCRSAAFFLGIEDIEINKHKLKDFNWLWDNNSNGTDVFGHAGLRRFLGTYAGAIPFYIEAETSITDSFSNSTSQSSISDSINGLSDQARELNFLMGTVSSATGGSLDNFVGTDGASKNLENISDQIKSMMGGKNNILSNLTNHVSTILSGGKMIFPEIWTDSSFSRSYSVKLKFPIPSGDKLSIFLYGLVPVFHCLGFVLPRQSASQAYYSPFLVRACYKGIFNVDMGIIEGMSFTKGSDGEWTDDGLPTVIEVSLDIKDLYNGMFMSKQETFGDMSIMSNITELDYIANMCGININEPDVRRTVEMYLSLGFVSNIKDRVQLGIWGGLTQWANQKFQKIFGKF